MSSASAGKLKIANLGGWCKVGLELLTDLVVIGYLLIPDRATWALAWAAKNSV
jgi:hypothetical protein